MHVLVPTNEPTAAGAAWQRSAHANALKRSDAPTDTAAAGSKAARRRRGRLLLPCGELIELAWWLLLGVGWVVVVVVQWCCARAARRYRVCKAWMDEACAPLHVRSFHWRPVRHTHAWSPSLLLRWCTAARLQLMRGQALILSLSPSEKKWNKRFWSLSPSSIVIRIKKKRKKTHKKRKKRVRMQVIN